MISKIKYKNKFISIIIGTNLNLKNKNENKKYIYKWYI